TEPLFVSRSSTCHLRFLCSAAAVGRRGLREAWFDVNAVMIDADAVDEPRVVVVERLSTADRIYRGAATFAGASVMVLMGFIGLMLLVKSWSALMHVGAWTFITTSEWQPEQQRFGIAAILVGTIVIAAVALTLAVPISLATAIFISQYAPLRL